MKVLNLIAAIIFIAVAGCSGSAEPESLKWLDQLIEKFKSEPVGNPPQSIWQYEYKGQVVYYVPPQCCDQFSSLYDANGNEICAPDGGLAGTGDGRCPDFILNRSNERLVWKDPRTSDKDIITIKTSGISPEQTGR